MKYMSTWKHVLLLCFIVIINVKEAESRKEGSATKLNGRPVAKTIQTEDGDIFDCVDIKRQPAFDLPVLKNHVIQMEPSSYPAHLRNFAFPSSKSQAEIRTVPCPSGTIPIRRSDKEHPPFEFKKIIQSIYTVEEINRDAGHALAGLSRTKDVYGARAGIDVYEPAVQNDDKSAGMVTIVGVDSDNAKFSNIGAGWFVWRVMGGDHRVRFHTFHDNADKECFDHECPGFIQVNSSITLGSILAPASEYNGRQYALGLLIFKDPEKGMWWLSHGPNVNLIGYWPNSIFPYLKQKGDVTFWGGLVESPTGRTYLPPMGSGHPSSEGYGKAAHVFGIKVMAKDGEEFSVPSSDECVPKTTYPNCYTADNTGTDKEGMFVYFGGPGCKF